MPSSPQGSQSICGFCGFADAQPFTYCPRCGRPVARFGDQAGSSGPDVFDAPTHPGAAGTFGEAPTDANTHPFAPQYPRSPSAGFFAPAGQSGPVGVNAPQASGSIQAAAPRRRKRWVAVTGVLVALLLLTTGGVFAYTLFFGYSATDTARYLPATTIFYSSLDLQKIAQNKYQVAQNDLAGVASVGLECGTGLNFKNDMLPWIGPSFTYALVSLTTQTAIQNTSSGPSGPSAGTVCLIATRDTSGSNAAIQKVVKNQQQKYGVTFTSITHGGVTLQSDEDSIQTQKVINGSNGASPLVLGTFKNQVLVANTLAVAEQVIDRANGAGSTLASTKAFTDALSKLPSDRVGTLYLNVQELTSALLTFGGSNSPVTGTSPYPVGYGSVQFTNQGLRVTFTLQAQAGTVAKYDLSGDTNASAAVVPASALVYGGLGDLSAYYAQLKDSTHGLLSDTSFQRAVGLAPDDPLFKAPVSFAVMATSNKGDLGNIIDGLVLLHITGDPASANQKVHQALQTIGAHTSTSTISGVTVTTIQTQQTTVQVDPKTGKVTHSTGYQTQAYYALLGHDLVFGSSTNAVSQAISTFQGKQQSLAQAQLFQQMVSAQPKNVAFSLFISLQNLANAPGTVGQSYRQAVSNNSSVFSKARGVYVTSTSTNQGITITEDIALQ